jgi:environmental stress-induced protein Ves
MAWKNGAGTTLEIARDGGTGLESFGWRFSIADVGMSGGFSAFTGYQRIITVLQGVGMVLTVDGKASRPLRPLDPFAFSGNAVVDCVLLAGAIRDFNLIYDPNRFQARLQWLLISDTVRLYTSASVILIFSLGQAVAVDVQALPSTVLGKQDSVLIEQEGVLKSVSLASADAAFCCVIELTPA